MFHTTTSVQKIVYAEQRAFLEVEPRTLRCVFTDLDIVVFSNLLCKALF